MITTEITCDSCARDITRCGSTPDFRLALTAEAMPHSSDIVHAVDVAPPIDRAKHFCDTDCLRDWCLREHPKHKP